MDLKLVRRVFGNELAWCGDCGLELSIQRRDVFGFGIQCPDCIRKRVYADATPPNQEKSGDFRLRQT